MTGKGFIGWYTAASGGEEINNVNIAAGTKTYYAVWDDAFTVKYNANGGSGTMPDQTIPAGGTAALSAIAFTGTDATPFFLEWNTEPDGTGVSYADGADYTAPGTVSEGESVTLYAIWWSPPIMQNMSSSVCTTTPTLVRDYRDDSLYYVGRLVDGKCWMLDNLAIDLLNSKRTLTAANTNASTTSLNYLYGVTSRDPAVDPNGKYATSGVSEWWTSGTSSDPLYAGSFSDPVYSVVEADTIPTIIDPMPGDATAGNWKVGGHYNYCAASAGTLCYGNGKTNATYPSTIIDEDICPAGWRLPTSDDAGGTGEVQYLDNYYSGDEVAFRRALHLPFSGSTAYGVATYGDGFWWTSNALTRRSEALGMDFDENMDISVNAGWASDRSNGHSIRCVLK